MWVLCCVHCAEKAKTPYLNEKWGFKWFASACPARPRHENIFKIFEILEIIEIHFRPKTSLPVLSFDFVFVFHPCLDLRRLPLQGSIYGLRGHLQTGVWVSFPPLQRPGSLCHSPGQTFACHPLRLQPSLLHFILRSIVWPFSCLSRDDYHEGLHYIVAVILLPPLLSSTQHDGHDLPAKTSTSRTSLSLNFQCIFDSVLNDYHNCRYE